MKIYGKKKQECTINSISINLLHCVCVQLLIVNPLRNKKFLDVTKLKTFVDEKLDVAKMTNSLFNTAENAVGKGENAGYQHFLLFQQCFLKLSLGLLKLGWCCNGLTNIKNFK